MPGMARYRSTVYSMISQLISIYHIIDWGQPVQTGSLASARTGTPDLQQPSPCPRKNCATRAHFRGDHNVRRG